MSTKINIKTIVKPILPGWLLKLYSKWWTYNQRKKYANKPIEDVFTDIYEKNRWGGNPGEYFSGPGSIDSSVSIYVGAVKSFINDRKIQKVVDLGCGDFRIGSQLQLPNVKYVGIDIVPSLIKYNQKQFGNDNISFCCLNIIRDELPDAEVCLIRQVLQHLSNEEIAETLGNVKKYRYVIITEHQLPATMHVTPNKEKPHGPDTRLDEDSGVYPDLPPFNMNITEVLLETKIQNYQFYKDEKLVSYLVQNA